jgi:hypothetical protein
MQAEEIALTIPTCAQYAAHTTRHALSCVLIASLRPLQALAITHHCPTHTPGLPSLRQLALQGVGALQRLWLPACPILWRMSVVGCPSLALLDAGSCCKSPAPAPHPERSTSMSTGGAAGIQPSSARGAPDASEGDVASWDRMIKEALGKSTGPHAPQNSNAASAKPPGVAASHALPMATSSSLEQVTCRDCPMLERMVLPVPLPRAPWEGGSASSLQFGQGVEGFASCSAVEAAKVAGGRWLSVVGCHERLEVRVPPSCS